MSIKTHYDQYDLTLKDFNIFSINIFLKWLIGLSTLAYRRGLFNQNFSKVNVRLMDGYQIAIKIKNGHVRGEKDRLSILRY